MTLVMLRPHQVYRLERPNRCSSAPLSSAAALIPLQVRRAMRSAWPWPVRQRTKAGLLTTGSTAPGADCAA